MTTPPISTKTHGAATQDGDIAAVRAALTATRPLVSMWRDGLTVIALESALDPHAQDYLTFEQASAEAGIDIHEAPAQTVPTVEAVTGKASVLLLGGDTIVGGAQNRVINITILLKAAATTRIPVTCLEHGRWNAGRNFSRGRTLDHGLRGMMAQQVAVRRVNRAAGPWTNPDTVAFAADQGAVWNEIAMKQARASIASPTGALHDLYLHEEQSVDDFVRAFPMPAGSRGVAIGLFDKLVGLDLFDSAETLERQWRRLIEGAASALMDRQRAIANGELPAPAHRHLDSGALDRMLARAKTALVEATVGRSVGLGRDVRFTAPKVTGSALVHDGRAIHVALFRPA